jgi:hypothetical protein
VIDLLTNNISKMHRVDKHEIVIARCYHVFIPSLAKKFGEIPSATVFFNQCNIRGGGAWHVTTEAICKWLTGQSIRAINANHFMGSRPAVVKSDSFVIFEPLINCQI